MRGHRPPDTFHAARQLCGSPRLHRRRARAQFHAGGAQLGVSQSALSHTIRSLETRLGVRLLTRTTRSSVAPTEAGERLLLNLAPRFDEIEAELAALAELRDQPTGTVRINATDFVIRTLLWRSSRRSCATIAT